MPIDGHKLKSWPFQDVVQPYGAKECILYALGLGLGADPLDPQQLRFVYEDGLTMLPTMPVVLATPGFWLRDANAGIDWRTVLHGEQGLTIHRSLPATGTVIGRTSIEQIVDKGPGKAAILYTRRELYDQGSGALLCSLWSSGVCRGAGGFGGPSEWTRVPHPTPDRQPDLSCDLPTLPQAALIYRLSGDYNPLHADPAVAAAAGFDRPILHGLCTYGVAGYAILKTLCAYDAGRLRRLDVRFSAPVYPGETVRTEIWNDGIGRASFRALVLERDIVVLSNGLAEYDE
jgi:acyl dehydratase